jgi:hypothetical protein
VGGGESGGEEKGLPEEACGQEGCEELEEGRDTRDEEDRA